MKTFNRKQLFLALASASALGFGGAAQAVEVSATGLWQVSVFPYYTVKGAGDVPFNTLISIVNSTNTTKAVKVRFREGKASQEVLDFNVFLSPYDMWTGWLEPGPVITGSPLSGGVLIQTADSTCTKGKIVGTGGIPFRNDNYVGDLVEDDTLFRLQEGYLEMFEMATYPSDGQVAKGAKHSSTFPFAPFDCSLITDDTDGQPNGTAISEQLPATGGLSGTVSLVQPSTGMNVGLDPLPLVNFKTDSAFYSSTGSIQPDFRAASPFSTTGTDGGNARVSDWTFGFDAVSATIMRTAIINEFVLDVATNSTTNWVVTFPSKHHYIDSQIDADASPPFTGPAYTKDGSCDTVGFTVWNREEKKFDFGGGDTFSPPRQGATPSLCWEANVILWNTQNLFSSTNILGVPPTFENGWSRIDLHGAGLVSNLSTLVHTSGGTASIGGVTTEGYSFAGLPTIGFAVQTFRVTDVNSYAGTFPHRWNMPYDNTPE